MTREHWLSLGLQEDALSAFEGGGLQTIGAADSRIVGIPRHGAGHYEVWGARERKTYVSPLRPVAAGQLHTPKFRDRR